MLYFRKLSPSNKIYNFNQYNNKNYNQYTPYINKKKTLTNTRYSTIQSKSGESPDKNSETSYFFNPSRMSRLSRHPLFNSRLSRQSYFPKIIEKVYHAGTRGNSMSHSHNINYKLEINLLKSSIIDLTDKYDSQRKCLDTIYKENKSIRSDLKNGYQVINNELKDKVRIVETDLEREINKQKIVNIGIENQINELKTDNKDLKKLVNQVKEDFKKLQKKIDKNLDLLPENVNEDK